MKIIYLAWGSLLWNSKGLKLKEDWKKTNFKLPLNFSRISDNGKGRLTLVIDQENGNLNNVYYATTGYRDLNLAIMALKLREKTTKNHIGYLSLNQSKKRSKNLSGYQEEVIKDFLREKGYEAVVWTDLEKNFEKYEEKPFTKENAFLYLQSKKEKLYTQILEYIVLSKIYGNIKTNVGEYLIQKEICS